jgi:hypothetical protein
MLLVMFSFFTGTPSAVVAASIGASSAIVASAAVVPVAFAFRGPALVATVLTAYFPLYPVHILWVL